MKGVIVAYNARKSNNQYHNIAFVLDLPILINKNYKMK